ncbi:MAG: hypothetical protein IJW96_03170, partial [Clostridia bacterium]|nr:hypothetical protein [Clostridia bacterium]
PRSTAHQAPTPVQNAKQNAQVSTRDVHMSEKEWKNYVDNAVDKASTETSNSNTNTAAFAAVGGYAPKQETANGSSAQQSPMHIHVLKQHAKNSGKDIHMTEEELKSYVDNAVEKALNAQSASNGTTTDSAVPQKNAPVPVTNNINMTQEELDKYVNDAVEKALKAQPNPVNVSVKVPTEALQKAIQVQQPPVNVKVNVPQEAIDKAVQSSIDKLNEKGSLNGLKNKDDQQMAQQLRAMPMQVNVQVPQEALTQAVQKAMANGQQDPSMNPMNPMYQQQHGQQYGQPGQPGQPGMQGQGNRMMYFQQPMMQNVAMANVVEPVQQEAPVEEPVVEKIVRDWTLRCPNCGKYLKVSDRTPYHRCPACTKVFQMDRGTRAFKTGLEKKMEEGMPVDTQSLAQKMTEERPVGMPEGLPEGLPQEKPVSSLTNKES